MQDVVALDVETLPISSKAVMPRVICCSFASEDWSIGEVVGNNDLGHLEARIAKALEGDVVGHNMAFDLSCITRTFPDLRPAVWKAYAEGRVHDTIIREKLIHLGTHGSLDALAGKRIDYSLAGIAKDRLGVDMEDDKSSGIRTRYHEMDGKRAEDYPREFYEYSRQDAEVTFRIFWSQQRKEELFKTEWLHARMAWCLAFSTERGIKVDKNMVLDLWDKTKREIHLENFPLLKSSGIITPACFGKPYKNNPRKKTKPKPEKVNVSKALIPLIERVCKENRLKVVKTDTNRTSTSKQVIEDLAPLDPVLREYQKRQSLSKLVTSYFPAMQWPRTETGPRLIADRIHPQYDVLKKTGRISSWGNSKKSKNPLYPSVNIQQVDPRVRACYIPREGFYLLSVDYSALELVALADTVYKLYGRSRLREQLNEGVDPHAKLGARLAGEDFESFLKKREEDPGHFKSRRKRAKPVGLGYPGGMGTATMIKACAGYGFRVTETEAMNYKDAWLKEYPVMHEYLAHEGDDERTYVSPLGMVRAGCSYTQYCNGKALQTPGAEGMKLATFALCREIYDAQSPALKGCHFLASIHDEVLLEVPVEKASGCADRVSEIMVREMLTVLTSMNRNAVRVEAALMKRWDKRAEPVYVGGELVPWEE